jgi:hypothetical protein
MNVFPGKDNIRRPEQELRLQPFTLLAAAPVALVVVAAITYTCVYSDTPSEVSRHALISGVVSLPVIILFATVWKEEARRPFSVRARRVAWQGMFYSYLAVGVAMALTAIFLHVPMTKRLSLIACFGMSLPMGFILYQLTRTNEKRG